MIQKPMTHWTKKQLLFSELSKSVPCVVSFLFFILFWSCSWSLINLRTYQNCISHLSGGDCVQEKYSLCDRTTGFIQPTKQNPLRKTGQRNIKIEVGKKAIRTGSSVDGSLTDNFSVNNCARSDLWRQSRNTWIILATCILYVLFSDLNYLYLWADNRLLLVRILYAQIKEREYLRDWIDTRDSITYCQFFFFLGSEFHFLWHRICSTESTIKKSEVDKFDWKQKYFLVGVFWLKK